MRRLIFLALFLVFFGCAGNEPAFYNCCNYDNASAGDGCITANGTVYVTNWCDANPNDPESKYVCNVTVEDSSGNEKEELIPVCPRSELLKCNSTCMGMFCGSFEFDPRPPVFMDEGDLNSSKDDKSKANKDLYTGTERGGAKGLYNGECRMLDMTPATLKGATNTKGGFALNVLRFGVGDSFADFDEALMYYPLTDLGCGLNPAGTIDRYANYYIPNKASGGELCTAGGVLTPEGEIPTYFCSLDNSIKSHSYQDCATRCSLKYYGDEPAVDPLGAYPSVRNGKFAGNPFAYGLRDAVIGIQEFTAKEYDPDEIYKEYPGDNSFEDDYPLGYNYYGAEFGRYAYPMGDHRGGIAFVLTSRGQPTTTTASRYDYYAGEYDTQILMSWPASGGSVDDDEGAIIENILTVERDPHLLYAFLLSHHSVYSKQFSEGHYTPEGTWAPGAEFECTLEEGGCLSAYCNTFDYKRGACIKTDGTEVPCDCWYDYLGEGGVVCQGRKSYSTQAVDNGESIDATAVLAAPVDTRSNGRPYQNIFYLSSLPSKGRVVSFKLNDPAYISQIAESDENDEDVAFLVILLGGEETYPSITAHTYDMETLEDPETMRSKMLTIPQVLSREKWSGCGGYLDCGKFYTTFVDQCVPTYSEDPEFYDDYFDVCYSGGGYLDFFTEWRGMYIEADDGTLKNENWNCQGLARFDEKKPEGKKTAGQVYCYEWGSTGVCASYATSALVIRSRPVTYNDEEGNEVKGYAFGNCLLEADGKTLKTKTYGYCEQCSYLTMAKEKLVALPENKADPGYVGTANRMDNKYCPSLAMKTILAPDKWTYLEMSYNGQFGSWESGGTHRPEEEVGLYSQCEMPDGTEVGKQQAWPSYLPDAYYMKSKLEDYLQRNVMPVLFAEDPGLWMGRTSGDKAMLLLPVKDDQVTMTAGDVTHPMLASLWEKNPELVRANAFHHYETTGTFLADSVIDQGAGIIVVQGLNSTSMSSMGDFTDNLRLRKSALNLLCPNCMVAISTGYGPGESSYQKKMELVSKLFEYRYEAYADYAPNITCFEDDPYFDGYTPVYCIQERLDMVDVIAVKWVLDKENTHCDDIENETERFAAILADEIEFGSKMLSRFGKPIVVTDLEIVRGEPGGCFTEESASDFMEYLGANSEALVRSGHIGVIYGDWTEPYHLTTGTTAIREKPSNQRGTFFEGTLSAAVQIAGYQKKMSVFELGVAENCTCIPCEPTDPAEICTGEFEGSGPLCTYDGPRVMVKWPDGCITEDVCMPDSELSMYAMDCVYESEGQEVGFTVGGYEIAQNPELYKQMIASIENSGTLPCSLNRTFRKKEMVSFFSHPILMRIDGNMSYSCNPLSATQGSFCGPAQQMDLSKMHCALRFVMPTELPIPEPGGGPSGPLGS